MLPERFPLIQIASKAILSTASLVGFSSSLSAATVYIGSAATQGLAVTAGAFTDTVPTVTYAFVATNGMAQTYVATAPTTIQLSEVNFYRKAVGAGQTGSVTPFVAIYSGDLTQSSVNSGANYSVVSIGDTYTFSGGAGGLAAGLENRTFTGANTQITLSAGQTLIAGYLNSTIAGLVTYDSAVQNAVDYTRLANSLPASVPNNLTQDDTLGLNRTSKFNIGFTVVPEPSAFLLSIAGLGTLALRRRR